MFADEAPPVTCKAYDEKLVESVIPQNADESVCLGITLARAGRQQDARRILLSGEKKYPTDPRFPTELAGVAFQKKRYAEASHWLRRSLYLASGDKYANNFLATIYFLQGNMEGAFKYWNRVGKPQINELLTDPELKTRALLLQRAIAISPHSLATLDELKQTNLRMEALEVFRNHSMQLPVKDDGSFDLEVHTSEQNGFGTNRWQALLSTFGGVFYSTAAPAYYNLHGEAKNTTSLVRWDSEKRRLAMEYSSPVHFNPAWRWRAGFDMRNENWEIRDGSTNQAADLGGLKLYREQVATSVSSIWNARVTWTLGGSLSYRDYAPLQSGTTVSSIIPNTALISGWELSQISSVDYNVISIPEHRLKVNGIFDEELSRIWSSPSHTFLKSKVSFITTWFPQSIGNDYAVHYKLHFGTTAGRAPFDEFYLLGIERDSNLWLRAHPGTDDGRKGSSPLARRFLLSNFEIDKILYSNGLMRLKIAPILDVARAGQYIQTTQATKWLFDTGAEAKLSTLGVDALFIYGKDLRSGNNTFYATLSRKSW